MKNQKLFLGFLCGVVALLVIAAAGPSYVGKVRYVSDISTNQIPLAGVTNAGTAAYSNSTAFLLSSGAFTGNTTVLTNGANTETLHITNGLIYSITAP